MIWPLKQWRRAMVAGKPFTEELWQAARRNVCFIDSLSGRERERLQQLMQIFLAEKRFEGCAGLKLTDEIRITIAAQACLLILNHDKPTFYPRLRSILVYPSRYIAQARSAGPGGVITEGPSLRLGESWDSGYVVLAWDEVKHGASCASCGHNVTLHEFAHQLDSESGGTDGAPLLEQKSMYLPWARVLGREFSQLQQASAFGKPTLLRKYGAASPAEFFAVATEAFFEQPQPLQRLHPELYEQLELFYRQDPAAKIQRDCDKVA